MSRRALAWILSVPLMVGGIEAGHWLAYRLAYPDAYARQEALSGSGHGYLSSMPLVLALAGALGLCAFGARAIGRGRAGGGSAQVSLVPFLLLSPIAFALQECLERSVDGIWPLAALSTPTFLPGLLFQVPFALAAFLIARWLLRIADTVQTALVYVRHAVRVWLEPLAVRRCSALHVPRIPSLAFGCGERGPPAARLAPAFSL